MSFLPSISSSELSRFARNWLGRVALIAVVVVPSLYGGLLVWANRDVTTHLSGMRAAVVNQDEMVTITDTNGKKQPVMVGRLVAGKLTTSEDQNNLDWELTDAQTANKGLDDGTYYAVLTIPKGFSAAAVSTQDADTVRAATMDLRTNAAVSYLSGIIASAIGKVVAQQTGQQLSEQYLDKVYLGFNQVKSSLTKAGDGADKLADGSKKVSAGAGQLDAGAGRLTVGLRDLATGADRLATGSDDLSGGVGQLVTGAGTLANGAGQVANGNAQLAAGLNTIEAGTSKMPGQSKQLADGGRQVSTGAQRLATGAGALDDGLQKMKSQTAPLPGRTEQLADGAHRLQDGATRLGTGGAALAPAAAQLTTGAAGLQDGAEKLDAASTAMSAGSTALADGTARLADGAEKASDGVTAYTGAVDKLAASCEESGAAPTYCAQLAAVAQQGRPLRDGTTVLSAGVDKLTTDVKPLAAGAEALSQGVTDYADGATRFADGATKYAAGASQVAAGATALGQGAGPLADGLDKLAAGVPALTDGISSAAGGAARLSDGATQLSTGADKLGKGLDQLAAAAPRLANGVSRASDAADKLAAGSAQVSTGANKLSTGASKAADGADQLAAGADRLSTGAGQARDGAGKLADGSSELADGAGKVADGQSQLAKGLNDGAKKAPSYTETQRDRLGNVVSRPVVADFARENAVPSYGHGLAPYFMAIGLWVGAMGLFFIIRPLPQRAIASTAAPWRAALAGFAPPALIGSVQAVVLVFVVRYWVGLQVADMPALFAIAVLTSLSFVAVNQALVSALGTKGRFLALMLVVLQLSASGATYPIETSPGFFQHLHAWLPLTHGVIAIRALIAGGGLDLTGSIATLVAWIVVALTITILAARKQRMWTPQRLRPRFAL